MAWNCSLKSFDLAPETFETQILVCQTIIQASQTQISAIDTMIHVFVAQNSALITLTHILVRWTNKFTFGAAALLPPPHQLYSQSTQAGHGNRWPITIYIAFGLLISLSRSMPVSSIHFPWTRGLLSTSPVTWHNSHWSLSMFGAIVVLSLGLSYCFLTV